MTKKTEATKSTLSKVTGILCAVLVYLTLAHVALAWSGMSDVIPVHYGFDGQVDAWGSKYRVLVVAILMLAIYAGIEVAERHPAWWNTGVKVTDENREGVYRATGNMLAMLKTVIVVSLSAVSVIQVEGGSQPWFLFPASMVALVAVPVFWIVRVYRMR